MTIKNKALITIFFISTYSNTQEILVPDQTISPWSFPEDCRYLMHNAGAVSKKLTEKYQEISTNPTANKKELEAIKNLSDINLSLAKTYEVFCKK